MSPFAEQRMQVHFEIKQIQMSSYLRGKVGQHLLTMFWLSVVMLV